MGTSLIQSAYSMTDMIWVGTLGSRAVTAVGTAGFFTWFAFAFITIPQIGAAVGVAQSVGRKDIKETRSYIRHSIQMNIVFAILYGATLIIFRKQLVGFFNIKGDDIVNMAYELSCYSIYGNDIFLFTTCTYSNIQWTWRQSDTF